MSVNGEKKFVIKRTFKNVKPSKVMVIYEGDREKHFGVPWKIRIWRDFKGAHIYLDCLKVKGTEDWRFRAETNGKIGENKENMNLNDKKLIYLSQYSSGEYPSDGCLMTYDYRTFKTFISNGNVTIELEVKITEASGIDIRKLRNFDDEKAKEHSDVMLKIGDRKFYVYKMYLSLQSSYFKSLFTGNFEESKKSEIELKDINPDDMQKFLEVLYGEDAINDDDVIEILKLADMYDSITATTRCESFLSKYSKKSLPEKFKLSLEFKFDNLTFKCISEMNTAADLRAVVPEDAYKYDQKVWAELYSKAAYKLPYNS